MRVTDNGSPNLSTNRTFTVTVGHPLHITAIALSPTNSVTIRWDSVASSTYRLQYKINLNDTNWTDVAGDMSAASPSTNKTDVAVTNAQRFYRVLLLD